jgi:RHS repeat-associated protein
LDTPRQLINGGLQLRWSWDNADPFGNTTANQNPQGLGAFGYNLRFPGQYYDSESGLHYNANRDYDPKLGRYYESDPIGLAGGLNTYGYVGANPVGAVDPLGLDEFRLYATGQRFVVSGRFVDGGTIVGGALDPLALANYGVHIGMALGTTELAVAKYLAGG